MAERTVIHVGAMKSGTSHVQSRLFANAEALLGAGVLVPGRGWGDQVQGAKDLIRMHNRGEASGGAWARLERRMERHEGTAVISMEYLGPVRPAVVAGVARSVPGLEVVVSLRDLNRSLAAMWQETVQNGRSWAWDDYLAAARDLDPYAGRRAGPSSAPSSTAGETFWRQQHAVRMIRSWGEVAPVTVVTVPPPGASRSLLWQRFCRVLGVPESGVAGQGWAEADAANESIGAASALALRRLNELLDAADLPFPQGAAIRKKFLAKEVLAARKRQEPSLGLPVADWVRRSAGAMLEELRASDVRLEGDWADLTPVDVPGVDPADVADADVTEAALAGLAAMVLRGAR